MGAVLKAPLRDITCVLCGSKCRTRGEHVFPQWVSKLLKDRSGGWKDRNDQIRDDIDVLLDICQVCNKSFNRQFEQPAQSLLTPMIVSDGQSHELTGPNMKPIARWLLKTALFCRMADGKPIQKRYEAWLRQSGRPKPVSGTAVWVGQWRDMIQPEQPPVPIVPTMPPPPDPKAQRVAPFYIGDMVAVVAMDVANESVLPESGAHFLRIWPHQLSVTEDPARVGGFEDHLLFPPVHTVSRFELESLRTQLRID